MSYKSDIIRLFRYLIRLIRHIRTFKPPEQTRTNWIVSGHIRSNPEQPSSLSPTTS